jgi:hypothetical protein
MVYLAVYVFMFGYYGSLQAGRYETRNAPIMIMMDDPHNTSHITRQARSSLVGKAKTNVT